MHQLRPLPCSADTLTRVRGEVTDLKNVMVDNIEKVGRGLLQWQER